MRLPFYEHDVLDVSAFRNNILINQSFPNQVMHIQAHYLSMVQLHYTLMTLC